MHVNIIPFGDKPQSTTSPKDPCKSSAEMASDEAPKSAKVSKEDFDIISNRIAVALAKRESLIKSWTASSSRPREPEKTEAELEAEDAALFRNEPPYLGVGAPIPSHFLVSEAERNNKSLRAKFFPSKTLNASKARDAEEKAASAKRGLNAESSDEEQGRSGLGRAKKRKTLRTKPVEEARKNEVSDHMGGKGASRIPKIQSTNTNQVAKSGKGENGAPKTQNTSIDHAVKVMRDEGSKQNEKKSQDLAMSLKPDSKKEVDDLADDVATTKRGLNAVPAILQKIGILDPEERKRMKKREKRKRQKERLKAAGKV